MAERCRAGVEVHLLFDAFGAAGMPSRYAATLRDAGCQFALFPTSLLRVNHRQHRRVLVVDGRIGFTGGSGLADKWLGNGRQVGHWRDTDVRLEGPIVAQLQAAFVEVWHEATGVVLTGPRYFPVLTPQGPARARIVTSAPSKHEFGIYTTLLLAMRAARQEILVTNPYFLPDAAMEAALLDAIHRGVRVSVLVPGPLDWTLVRAASRAGFGPLLEAGIAIWEYRPAMLHAKTMVIDGTLTMVGSANLDPRSYAIDAELDVFVLDPTLAHRMEAVFADDLTRARRVRYARWYARPFWRRLLEWLAIPLRSEL